LAVGFQVREEAVFFRFRGGEMWFLIEWLGRHVAHAETTEEAQYLLMRWATDGMGKVASELAESITLLSDR
jgi:hypothetical protein